MLSRRLLGIFILAIAIVAPAAGDEKADKDKADKVKAVTDAKAALTKAEADAKTAKEAFDKADKASKDKPTDEPLKKAAAEAKTKLDAATKAVDEAKAKVKTAEDAAKEKPPESKGEKAVLKWKFEKGKDFYQKMTTKTKQVMTVMNNKVEQNQEQTFFFKWTVKDVKADEVILVQKIEGVIMNIDIGQQKISYDSTKEKDAGSSTPLADFFKALKDSEFTITLNTKDMKVTKLEGRAEFIDKLGKQNPQMKPLLETILSEKALMQMAEPTFAAIPGVEKKTGESWEKDTTLDMGPIGKYDNKYKYTFESKDKDKDKIKVEATLKYTPPAAGEAAGTGGLPFKIKSASLTSTKADGTIIFDETLGRIVSSTMKLKLVGKLSIEIGGQTTDVELDQDQDSVVENADKSFIEKK